MAAVISVIQLFLLLNRRKLMKLIIGLLALLLVFPTTLAGQSEFKTIPIDWNLAGSLIHVDEGAIIDVNLKGKP
jgi:hypothetical protein